MFSSHFPCLQELQREKNSVTVQLDQSSRRLSQLEEEKKGADQSFKRTQGLLDDLKGKLVIETLVAEFITQNNLMFNSFVFLFSS